MQLDNKKKGMLLIMLAAVVGVALIFVLLSWKDESKKEDEKVVVISDGGVKPDMPEPSVEDLPGDQRENQKRRGIESYWDDMAKENVSDDPVADMMGEGKDEKKKGGIPSYEEIFSKNENQAPNRIAQQREEREKRNAKEMADLKKYQQDLLSQAIEADKKKESKENKAELTDQEPEPEQAPAPVERDKINVERIKVVRSGGMSSLDDGFGSMGSSGLSTLDGADSEFDADDFYPFRCMFVRQEKLKSGQRVSIRLLEDIVVEGQLVRKDTHLNAICNISDRIDLSVTSLDLGGRIINLDFEAYDTDGTKGIYAPDLQSDQNIEKTLKQVGSSAIRRRASSAVGQTAQDVIAAGTALITGTGKEKTVIVPSGYQFYLVKKKRR